jgi:hypothetical protein
MKEDLIVVDAAGVTIDGFPLGLEPTMRDFELALDGKQIRGLPPSSGRQLWIADSEGLRWLVDLEKKLALWFHIALEKPSHRREDGHDPINTFKGKIRIGTYTVQGPFLFEIGEMVRTVEIPRLGISLVPGKKHICTINIAFLNNESRV